MTCSTVMKPETVIFTKIVPLSDADGKPICEGSVLKHTEDGERGVVVRIVRPTDATAPMFSQVGDVLIQTAVGCQRGTNNYGKWRHIPHNEQTPRERFDSWMCRKYDHDEDRGISEDAGLAIDGIMALLPDNIVDWEYGPWPDSIEDALRFLVAHLSNERLSNGGPTHE